MKVWKQFWQQNKEKKIIITAIILLGVVALASLCMGVVRLSLSEIWEAFRNYGSGEKTLAGNILWSARIPRTIACLASGAALAVSGAVIQGVLANKLASPSTIGVNAGAGLAFTICCAFDVMNGWAISLFTFLGALFVVLLVSITAQKMNASRTTVILAGVAVNSFLNAATEALTSVYKDAAVMSVDFRVGGFTAPVSLVRLVPAVVLILVALIVVMSLHNELDLMTLGEEMAQGLGLSVKKMRTIFLILAALLAGASVSFAGLLGFVGLIIPHMMRFFVGGENRYLIPMCALGGAIFVTLCDIPARMLFAPFEVPVGVFISFIGGPFFIWMLLKKRGGRY